MKEKVIPILAIVIGLVAFILTRYYLSSQQAEIEKEWEKINRARKKIPVMVAARRIPRGTRIEVSDVTKQELFETTVPVEAVHLNEGPQILGKQTLYSIESGDVMRWSYIEGGRRSRGLAQAVKPGMRAMSLSIGGSAAVSGMILPEDRVDILGTFTFPSEEVEGQMETVTLTVLQDVTILATGQRRANEITIDRERTRDSSYNTITVQITPREAELLTFAEQMRGRLTLTLRNPGDVYFEKDLPKVNFKYLVEELPELNLHRQRVIRHKSNF